MWLGDLLGGIIVGVCWGLVFRVFYLGVRKVIALVGFFWCLGGFIFCC